MAEINPGKMIVMLVASLLACSLLGFVAMGLFAGVVSWSFLHWVAVMGWVQGILGISRTLAGLSEGIDMKVTAAQAAVEEKKLDNKSNPVLD